MEVVAFIFARGGSKGLPGKNLMPLLGKPLLGWAIEQAQAVKDIKRVIVSTDSPVIAETAKKYGAEAPFLRPAKLSTDASPEWLAWRHALEWFRFKEGHLPDVFVSVPPTAPLRQSKDVEAALHLLAQGRCDVVITVTPARRSPWFNMVVPKKNGTVKLVLKNKKVQARRQECPQVFDITTVAYVAASNFICSRPGLFAGRVRALEVPVERAIDIDNILDFQIAELVMRNNLKKI